ncbi:MAG: alpha/beta hydrolase [Bacteroidota bacterium]
MKKLLATLFLCSLVYNFVQAQAFETLTYFQDDTLQLELDLFLPQNTSQEKIPLVIFVHGGGFSGGKRAGGHNFANYLALKGYAVASITYTLYMKGRSFSCDAILSEKIKAIQLAANHLWLATGFMLDNAEKYKIDTSQIFIAGSSAGAETVFHAAFWDYEVMNLYSKKLPFSFKYAGLISGAGAIMDINMITKKNLIPVMMFHGNNDPLVPYGTAAHHFCQPNTPGWLMLFGSYSVFNHVSELNGDVRLLTYCGGGHEFAARNFNRGQEPIYEFLEKVREGARFQIHDIFETENKAKSPPQYQFCN